jgi:hypothetical protein
LHSIFLTIGLPSVLPGVVDYKISIILGACSIVFFFLHSLLAKLR